MIRTALPSDAGIPPGSVPPGRSAAGGSALQRGLACLMAAIGLAALTVSPALAKPPDTPIGQPDSDTFLGTRTPAQAAFEQTKLAIVAAIETPAPAATPATGLMTTGRAQTVCDTSCDYYDGGDAGATASPPPPGTATTGGETGYLTPKSRVVLEVHARHQMTVFWCGPPSGQVGINYSRGYD